MADAADSKEEPPPREVTPLEKLAGIGDPREPELTPVAGSAGQSWGDPATESALAEALRLAARAGRWDVVIQLAKELESRRVRE
jgi:hypothetical protein